MGLKSTWRVLGDTARFASLVADKQKVNALDRAGLARLQNDRLRVLLRHAVEKSPFYRARYRGLDIERCALTDLPPFGKAEMMASFDELVTEPDVRLADVRAFLAEPANLGKRFRDRYVPLQSSGTTGRMGTNVYDVVALEEAMAALAARQAMPRHPSTAAQISYFGRGLFGKKGRHAVVAVTAGPSTTYVASLHAPAFVDKIVDTRYFSTALPLSTLVAGLNDWQPDTLLCYPTTLEQLAREQLAGRLRVPFDSPLATITTGAEPLTPSSQQLARRAWGLEIEDIYALTECFSVARSCPRFTGLHVMSDLCILEVVDEANRPVPDGTRGAKVLLTNLYNRVQPLIRYEVTDVTGISTEPCDCGWPFPRLLPIEGRTLDLVHVARAGGGYESISLYRFGFLFLIEELTRFQVVQTARDQVVIRYVTAVEGVAARLEAQLATLALPSTLRVSFERVAELGPDPRTGKFRQMISEIDPPADWGSLR